MECLVVVAHPDDETIWAGGTILSHQDWHWTILTLCRRDDADRRHRFAQAVKELDAHGRMSDLDDSPVLAPLSPLLDEIKSRVRELPSLQYDLILTHGPQGEYTRHRRHEQVHRAVLEMSHTGELRGAVACFAYDDCGGRCTPHPADEAQIRIVLNEDEYERKQFIISHIYGFSPDSFEQLAAGRVEAFDAYGDSDEAILNMLQEKTRG